MSQCGVDAVWSSWGRVLGASLAVTVSLAQGPALGFGGSKPGDSYQGPYPTSSAEYKLPATIDDQVLTGTETEAWARLYRPQSMPAGKRLPVVLMLHGNHATCGLIGSGQSASCEYTYTGSCGAGEEVIQNHMGYDYLATRLASWGYVVVSINANRGITCGGGSDWGDWGLNLARGRLVLRHLSLLSDWNRSAGATPSTLGVDLRGRLDLNQVGLMGHSRGGEGMRAALQQYRDAGSIWPAEIGEPVGFKAIFEIGPVDGQSNRVLNADGTAWNVLLPSCDGDVSDLQGMKPYDRMLGSTSESPALPKSIYYVWGANHNFYNTKWPENDSAGCTGTRPLWKSAADRGSAEQRQTAISSVIPFFRAYVGAGSDRRHASSFDPRYKLPSEVTEITRVERTFTPSPNSLNVQHLEDFKGADGIGKSGLPQGGSNVYVMHTPVFGHDASLRAARIIWNKSGSKTYFQPLWSPQFAGITAQDGWTLDFRVGRVIGSGNPAGATDFSVRLVFDDGSLGPSVPVSRYASIRNPVGNAYNDHEVLQSVRIPVSKLNRILYYSIKRPVRGVRFVFDRTQRGEIYISDVDFARNVVPAAGTVLGGGGSTPLDNGSGSAGDAALTSLASSASGRHANYLTANAYARQVRSGPSSNRVLRARKLRDGSYELEVESKRRFQVRDALPVLRLNGRLMAIGTFPRTGDLRRMTFRVSGSDVRSLPAQFNMDVSHREDPRGARHDFGRLHRTIFPR